MSEYKVTKFFFEGNERGNYTHLLKGGGIERFVDGDIFKVVTELNAEIASLQDAAAEKDAIIEAQSETIGTLKSFIRGTFPLEHPSDIRYANKDAAILVAMWEAASESEAVE